MVGLQQILMPIHIEMINKLGMTPLLPILAMSGAGQVGAAIALWIRCRNNRQLANMIKGALPVGILGIGGAVIGGLGNIGAIAIGPSGIALIPLIYNGHWIGYVIGLLAAYTGGFLVTYFFGIPASVRGDKSNHETLIANDTLIDKIISH